MTEFKKTEGFEILDIRLHRSSWSAFFNNAAVPGAKRDLDISLNTDFSEVSQQADGSTQFFVGLEVAATGLTRMDGVEPIEDWRAQVRFVGSFRIYPGSEVTVEQVQQVYGPSYLYSFSREVVGDMARRSALTVVLPPLYVGKTSNTEVPKL